MTPDHAILGAVIGLALVLAEIIKRLIFRDGSPKAANNALNGLATHFAKLRAYASSSDRKLELILVELRSQRDDRIARRERTKNFERRMEEHISRMECQKSRRTP